MSTSPTSKSGAFEPIACKVAAALISEMSKQIAPPTTTATALSKKRKIEPKAQAEKRAKRGTDDSTTSAESSQAAKSSKPSRPRKTPEEKAEAAREAKRLFQIKFATRKLDRTRYKGYMKNMNDSIHPIAFKTMDYETLLAVRTYYFESLREKVLKLIKNLNKRGEPVCQTFTVKNLWRYCFCFSSVFFSRGMIWRYNNSDIPSVESFGDFYPFMKHMGIEDDDLSNKASKVVTDFAQLVDNSVPLKRMMEPVLVQYGLLLRTFLCDSEAAGKKLEDEEEASEEAAVEQEQTVEEGQAVAEGQTIQDEEMLEEEAIEVKTTQVEAVEEEQAAEREEIVEEEAAQVEAVEEEAINGEAIEQEESTEAKVENL